MLIVCPLVVVRVAVPWTTLALRPHWFRGMPGRHGLITISMMLPLPGAVWASAFQATELASRIAAVAVKHDYQFTHRSSLHKAASTRLPRPYSNRTATRAHQGFRMGF